MTSVAAASEHIGGGVGLPFKSSIELDEFEGAGIGDLCGVSGCNEEAFLDESIRFASC